MAQYYGQQQHQYTPTYDPYHPQTSQNPAAANGEFYELSSFNPFPSSPVSSLSYDSGAQGAGEEIMWIGTGYTAQRGEGGLKSRCQLGSFLTTSSYIPYSYIPVSTLPTTSTRHLGITKILPLSPLVLTLTNSGVAAFNAGCMRQAGYDITEGTDLVANEAVYDGPNQVITHATVSTRNGCLKMLDLYSGLIETNTISLPVSVNCMDCNGGNNILAGCADGTVNLLDGRLRSQRMRYQQSVQAVSTNVRRVSISPNGHLVAASGGRGEVVTFDTRMTGRAPQRISANMAKPTYLKWIEGEQMDTLIVTGSGINGSIQISQPLGDPNYMQYLTPTLSHGESITCVDASRSGSYISCGTDAGNVVVFEREGWPKCAQPLQDGNSPKKVCIPPFEPSPPSVSIDPGVLLKMQQINVNPFNDYAIRTHPVVTTMGLETYNNDGNPHAKSNSTYFNLAESIVGNKPDKRILSKELSKKAEVGKHDFVAHVRAEDLGLHDTKDPQPPTPPGSAPSSPSKPNVTSPKSKKITNTSNHNQLIYNPEKAKLCYNIKADPRKVRVKRKESAKNLRVPLEMRKTKRPTGGTQKFDFSYSTYNDTHLWNGWDAGNNIPNAYACAVLQVLYFVPEFRASLLREQFEHRNFENDIVTESNVKSLSLPKPGALSAELGFLFHQMDSLSYCAYTNEKVDVEASVPANFLATFSLLPEAAALALLDNSTSSVRLPRRIEAVYRFLLHHLNNEIISKDSTKIVEILQGFDFASTNSFITGSGPPTTRNTRALTVELHYDSFIGRKISADKVNSSFSELLLDTLCRETRLRAWCNETKSYETILQKKQIVTLPVILSIQCSCAGDDEGIKMWRQKNAAGGLWLPQFIEIYVNKDGLIVKEWMEDENGLGKWKIAGGGVDAEAEPPPSKEAIPNVEEEHDPTKTPASKKKSKVGHTARRRYELISCVSYIKNADDEEEDDFTGNHIAHVKVPNSYKIRVLERQLVEVKNCIATMIESSVEEVTEELTFAEINNSSSPSSPGTKKKRKKKINMTNTSRLKVEKLQERQKVLEEQLETEIDLEDGKWTLFNGFVVKDSKVQQVRDFQEDWREPCLICYRLIEDDKDEMFGDVGPGTPNLPHPRTGMSRRAKVKHRAVEQKMQAAKASLMSPDAIRELDHADNSMSIPVSVMNALPINNSTEALYVNYDSLPGKGDLIAIDAEFVSVQHEDSVISSDGGRIVLMEGRSSLARMSMLDCRSGVDLLLDDYVLPQEPVLDFLTRFSGIVASDLDPQASKRHLVTMRTAYCKLRLLVDRGCIFVGHGLETDFHVLNVYVPPSQIIDTLVIYSQPKARKIGLRFLVNFFLGRDMQVDTHDSIEDAKAAWELYMKATEIMEEGKEEFTRALNKVYEYGRSCDW
eukprot:CAMPEP_0118652152 /NCGR_PEP_ID=MMETSP0785-20121206/11163_1 /TAXON_ID=91992 /ORGANISM="Bolidomonas pacifica, Strain CCMP 1866" /LENGTH=1394 /DNA_ID=CAMNT_0006544645 /DNA_START=18 /DNA_END=4199 /DNA_ORIENTATION=+